MKLSQKNYDTKFRGKNKLKLERCLRAANRLESYSFYHQNTISIPQEIYGNFLFRKDFYELTNEDDEGHSVDGERNDHDNSDHVNHSHDHVDEEDGRGMDLSSSTVSLWYDPNSIIAAPYSSELLLSNHRKTVLLGAPRLYSHQLRPPSSSTTLQPSSSSPSRSPPSSPTPHPQQPLPNAHIRFPYNDLANYSAKIITKFIQKIYFKKISSASLLQKNFQKYLRKKHDQEEYLLRNQSILIIQKYYQKYKLNFFKNSLIKKQNLTKNLQILQNYYLGYKKIKLIFSYHFLYKRIKFYLLHKKYLLHSHTSSRKSYRYYASCVCRIQAVFRGYSVRKKLKKQQDAGIILLYYLRRYYKQKNLKFILKIQRLYRNYQLKKSIILIQKRIRQKLSLNFYHRKILEIISNERIRANRECLMITNYLNNLSLNTKWMLDEEQIPFITTYDHIKRIDFYSYCVLNGSLLQILEPYHESIHPADYGEDEFVDTTTPRLISTQEDSLEIKLVKVILNLFTNRPGSCIDGGVFKIIKDFGYLQPKTLPSSSSSSSPFSLSSPFTSSSTSTTTSSIISESAWNTLENIPLLNIHSLFQILEPTKSLLYRVKLLGYGQYLPISILQQALLVNRWTLYYEFLLKRKIKKFRKFYPPRRYCPYCLEPMIFDGQLYDHRRCPRNGFPSWMLNDMKSIYNSLYKQCKNIQTINYSREYSENYKKLKEGWKRGEGQSAVGDGVGATAGGGSGGHNRKKEDDDEDNEEDYVGESS